LDAGYLQPQTHTQNKKYVLLFQGNNVYANAEACYVYMYVACVVVF